jgi:hypothetical protein
MVCGRRKDAWDRASLLAALATTDRDPDFFHPLPDGIPISGPMEDVIPPEQARRIKEQLQADGWGG